MQTGQKPMDPAHGERRRSEDRLDDALDDTFPASDPVSITPRKPDHEAGHPPETPQNKR